MLYPRREKHHEILSTPNNKIIRMTPKKKLKKVEFQDFLLGSENLSADFTDAFSH